ncbi:MAG: DUF2779 domain-containing protein [Ignavibacteriaceae bacterium]|nr:DUF2779 domain-containing protein [Ignavibacteriaceae bacterium]
MEEKHLISKSSFIKGIQCEKQLYLYKYHYDWMDEVSESQQLIFDRGHDVGELAQQLFPGGVVATEDPRKHLQAIARTTELIESGAKVIYEAAFGFDEVLVIADIVVWDGRQWNIYEVKSSTKISDTYYQDAAIQYYVISNCLDVNEISIVYINNQYVRRGKLELDKLFTIESVRENVSDQQDFIKSELKRLKIVLKGNEIPQIDIGPHCSDPYRCSFWGHCWKDIPDYSVFDIAGLRQDKKFELYGLGHIGLEDVPEDYKLSKAQRIQIESHTEKKTIADMDKINEFLSSIRYPIYYMDFETFMPAIPMFDGTRPYQQIPFQYSLHYQQKADSHIEHNEFLAEATDDPRVKFIENLLKDTKREGLILVYNKAFEITRLKELGENFPQYAEEINEKIERIADLMVPFQKKYYYTPEMQGSYSIKSVLPALVPELSYEGMEIADGGTASAAFESLYHEKDIFKIKEIRESLLKYCALDTLAMVEILRFLQKL